MKNNLFSHPGLKIASLVIAFAVWLIIMNVQNPETTKIYSNVPVNITNASYVESKRQLYAVVDGTAAVSVRINSNRSLIEKLPQTSINATADLTQITDFVSPVYVPVTVSIPGISPDRITVNPRMIEVKLEDIESSEFLINPTTGGTVPWKGHQIGKMTAKPDTVKIRGPKSVIDKIEKVSAFVDVSGMRKDASLSAEIEIFDRNGEPLNETQRSYLSIGDESTSVKVNVELYSVLSDVPIEAHTYGDPSDGYMVGVISTTPTKLSVVGDKEALAAFKASGGKILIPESSKDIDVTGASTDQDILIDISNYLPDGISLASETSTTVVVSIEILPYDSKSFEIETKNISKLYLTSNYTAVFDDSKLDIRVRPADTEHSIDDFDVSMIQASVNLSGCKSGNHNLPVKIKLPEGYVLVDEVTTDMTISKVTTIKTSDEKEQ